MDTDNMSKIISDFVNEEYPKGNEDRGFALVCLTLFLMYLNKNYDITKK